MSRLTKILRRISGIRDGIARRSQYDRINISDDLRNNSVKATDLYKRNLDNFRKVLRTEEDPLMETDINKYASVDISGLILTAAENGETGNLITVEILDGATAGSEVIIVEGKHISIGIEDGITDYDAVVALIEGDDQASALIVPSLDGAIGANPAALSDTITLKGGI